MRNLTKLPKPSVLEHNEHHWLQEYIQDPVNQTKRNRYRHPEIKATLKAETHEKCVYCESRIGHNTPGDVEHKVPTSRDQSRHFDWLNLTIACTECNRRKNDYYREHDGFLDPYLDKVDDFLDHNGPVVMAKVGKERGEIFVSILKLCSAERFTLVAQKIQKLNELQHILERYNTSTPGALKEILKRQLIEMASPVSEYSAMVQCALRTKGYLELLKPQIGT